MDNIMKPTAVIFIYEAAGKVLAVSRKDDHTDLNLPGGKVELNEEPFDAIKREVKEETGLDILSCTHIGNFQDDENYVAVYQGQLTGNKIETQESHLVTFCDWSDLFKGTFGKYNKMLYHVLKNSQNNLMKQANEPSRKDLDVQLWQAWKQDSGPHTLMPLMKQINPIVNNEVNRWKRSGIDPVLLEMEAKNLAFKSFKTFNPNKSQLNTHVTNNLKRLSRYTINNQNTVRTPEDKIYKYRKYMNVKDQIEQETGEDASMVDIEMRLNDAGKISDYKPKTEHYYSIDSEAGGSVQRDDLNLDPVVFDILSNKLNDRQKFILQHTFGVNGAPKLQNQEIAKKLGVSAPAVTKQKKVIFDTFTKYKNSLDRIQNG